MARKLALLGSRKKAFLQVLTSLTPFAAFDGVEQSFLREREKRNAAARASSRLVEFARCSMHAVAKLDVARATLWLYPQIRWISRRKTFRN